MLLQFAVENVLSFKERTVLSMMAAPHVSHKERDVIRTPVGDVLRVAAIYGANASGKSNLCQALWWAKMLIRSGTPKGEAVRAQPFRLSKTHLVQPSVVECEFLINDTRYSYGFKISSELVHEEWLLADGETLFERSFQQFDVASIGESEKRTTFVEFVAQGTRPNQLFLFEASDRNVHELESVWSWFDLHLGQIDPNTELTDEFARLVAKDGRLRHFATQLLANADTGVTHLGFGHDSAELAAIEKRVDAGEVVDQSERTAAIDAAERFELRLMHESDDGSAIPFELELESDGTKALLRLAPVWAVLVGTFGLRLVVDELDRSLHALLTRHLIESFLRSEPANGSQLLFTTHDTSLLDLALLPADSFWLAQKDHTGASTIYSLSEYKSGQMQQLREQVSKGYMQGRFGAVPTLGDPGLLAGQDGT